MNKRHYTLNKRIGLGLILGGAGGNLLDRLRLGYIVDFLDLRIWPVFNIADSAITVGIFLLAIELCFHSRRTTPACPRLRREASRQAGQNVSNPS